MFAGHSLGKYAVVCSVTGYWDIPALRNARGESDSGMVAVDPTRVAKGYSDTSLSELINAIDRVAFCRL